MRAAAVTAAVLGGRFARAGRGLSNENSALELDLTQIASRRARHRGRAGMGYILTRIRRELEARWAAGLVGSDGDRGDGDRGGDGEIDRGRAGDRDDGDGEIDRGRGRGSNGAGDPPNPPRPPRQVLLLDCAGSDLRLGDGGDGDGGDGGNDGDGDNRGRGIQTQRICALESPAAAQARLESAAAAAEEHRLDGIIICLQAAWLAWPAWPAHMLRALAPGGRLLFCTFGPDTLRELRDAWRAAGDDAPHAHPFLDMHHIGDELLRCGFQRPIVDADWVTVTYPGAAALHADLRAEGFTNIEAARRKTLTGKARFAAYQNALDNARAPGKPLAVTFELIYGLASAPLVSPAGAGIRVAAPGY
ncbi:MAG: hypothetical protein OXU98_10105 [Gammaproteobacteria bacterium]|nr:hypothetical protein [Gammaproteobacteria bacterium]